MTACGSDDGERETATLMIETRDRGPDEVALSAPAEVPAGPVRIELRNGGDTGHDAQLIRVDGKHGADDVVGVLESADSIAKPAWFHPSGGVAATRPGERAAVTQLLDPGTYYVVDTQERASADGARLTNATKGGVAKIAVTGDGGGDLPATRATITAKRRGYATSGIVAGANRVTFRNADKEIHQVVALPIESGVPFRKAALAAIARRPDIGWVPVDVHRSRATTVLEAGGAQVTELRLAPGRYALLCFVSARAGGYPQWARGMDTELEVAPTAREPGEPRS